MAGAYLGIDIGGTGIKRALVEPDTGQLVSGRRKLDTPRPATPEAVASVVAELVAGFDHDGPIGCTFPAIVRHGVVHTASNVDDAWIDTDAGALFAGATGSPVSVVNDADAAGVAEVAFGAAAGVAGTVLVLTLGTGIGSGLFVDGRLVPNTEFGHVPFGAGTVESHASNATREAEDLGWVEYARRLDEVLELFELLLSPDLFVLGGGISKRADKFVPRLARRVPVVPAALRNNAGIVGAAMLAARRPSG